MYIHAVYTSTLASLTNVLLEAIVISARERGINLQTEYDFRPMLHATDQLVGIFTEGRHLDLEKDHDAQMAYDVISNKAISMDIREEIAKRAGDMHPGYVQQQKEKLLQELKSKTA